MHCRFVNHLIIGLTEASVINKGTHIKTGRLKFMQRRVQWQLHNWHIIEHVCNMKTRMMAKFYQCLKAQNSTLKHFVEEQAELPWTVLRPPIFCSSQSLIMKLHHIFAMVGDHVSLRPVLVIWVCMIRNNPDSTQVCLGLQAHMGIRLACFCNVFGVSAVYIQSLWPCGRCTEHSSGKMEKCLVHQPQKYIFNHIFILTVF